MYMSVDLDILFVFDGGCGGGGRGGLRCINTVQVI